MKSSWLCMKSTIEIGSKSQEIVNLDNEVNVLGEGVVTLRERWGITLWHLVG